MAIGTSDGEHFADEAQYVMSRQDEAPDDLSQVPFRVAGDVVSLGLPGTPTSGHTNKSADYAWGNKRDPDIEPIPLEIMKGWLTNTANRIKSR